MSKDFASLAEEAFEGLDTVQPDELVEPVLKQEKKGKKTKAKEVTLVNVHPKFHKFLKG